VKKAIVLVTDRNYLRHALYLISALRHAGSWQDDICLISNDLKRSALRQLSNMGIEVIQYKKETNPYKLKYNLFNGYFVRWDVICYFDLDYLILGNLNHLFEENVPLLEEFALVCDREPFRIRDMFFDDGTNLYNELELKYDLDRHDFNSSCMMFKPNEIPESAHEELLELDSKYDRINDHTRKWGGGDQALFNLYFYDKWTRIQHVRCHDAIKSDTLAAHTCKWDAPWKSYVDVYNKYLQLSPFKAK
jgi:lipopolysaccharide biosynthesis glycosyltransferase